MGKPIVALRSAGAALTLALLAGCSMAPPYVAPQLATPAPQAFKEMGPWTPGAPADAAPRGAWWSVYGDTTLDALEGRLETGNPGLAAALARYDQARAYANQARSSLFPEIDASAAITRNRQSDDRPLRDGAGPNYYNNQTLGGVISYEFDLWGRVRNLVAAAKADAEASVEDLASVRLSLHAELADDYLALRGLDAQARLLTDTAKAYQKALDLTQLRHSGGVVSGLDVGRARTVLSSAHAALVEVGAQRALYEHAIASLVGEPASSFSIPVVDIMPAQPQTPVAAPSVLLQRRPDVAAAERRAYAANRQIGVAKAAFFPSLTLDASGGFQTAGGGANLIGAGDSLWTLGPQAVLPVFDAGKRRAVAAQARAQFDQASADYRTTALSAFQQVEDALALCNRLAEESRNEQEAADAARQTEELSLTRYQEGAVDYLEVVTAQAATLDAERSLIILNARRLQASVDLVKALGGGWNTPA
jgi:NodT family efflux transporter outer membrane factor (OMF) lipoprotein